MWYQLPNGKVIEISTEQYFEMSDEDFEYLIAYNYGEILENPWHGSILSKHDKAHDDNSEVPSDLTNIPKEDKFRDLDVDTEIQED